MLHHKNSLLARALLTMWLCTTTPAVLADDYALGMQALENGHTAQAIELWRPLAEAGNAEAQFGLGVIYNDAMGVAQDYAEANYWFLRAAEQGYAPAQFNLGNAYKNGTGMTPDPQMAVRWWRKAADQDFGPAQFNLGSALMEGFGIKRDADAGRQWYRRAAANGHAHAKAFLEELGVAAGDAQTQQSPAENTEIPRQDTGETHTEDSVTPVRDETAASPPATTPKTAAAAPELTTPEMTATAAATPDEARSAGTPADCADWLDRDANTFTVQLLSSQAESDPHQYAAQHALSDTAICSYRIKGRRWHALLYGRYDSSAAARAALASLPPTVRADGAYVRRIAEIRNALNKP